MEGFSVGEKLKLYKQHNNYWVSGVIYDKHFHVFKKPYHQGFISNLL